MAKPTPHIDTFPLEQLFQRLELAGFRLSPGDRLRALRVLGGPGKSALQQPEQLKMLLAPVLARSEAEQLKFYEAFDQYYREISVPLEVPDPPNDFDDWWRWLLILPLIAGLWYAYYALTQQRPTQENLSVYIDGPTFGSPGDTVLLKNQSRYTGDSSTLRWRWSYFNLATQEEELFDTLNFDWPLVVPPLDSGAYLREIRLVIERPEEDTVYRAASSFTVRCPRLPRAVAATANGIQQLEAGQEIEFVSTLDSSSVSTTQSLLYEWDFGDGSPPMAGTSAKHTFLQNGQYAVKLTVTDTSTLAFCKTTNALSVKVGRDQAFLPLYTLQTDRLSLLATWGWGFYVLLGVLGVSLLYYWVRWLMRRSKAVTPEQQETLRDQAFYARFAHSDKGPYFLPLRDQSAVIQYNPIATRLADALRMRQQGLRREIDVASTLQATLDGGGFPEVRFRYASQPSEYLCLIDEQDRASHLGQLFKYLASSLRGQDVNLEIYYYRKHFNQFWNKYFPKGRTLDQLQRAYPNHRLLVLGDLHELIDPHAQGQPRLRTARARLLRQWPLRLLLTPVPPVSWSYREKLLARLFNVFPSDSLGLLDAAQHLENEEELLPDSAAYDRWQERQETQRADADTEHRNWRRWRNIKAYLNEYDTELVRWFTALSVFPLPSWEMTIAIGRALGIMVTYDKLLYLARIPVLQSDRFDERLRRELQQDLNPTDERSARQAVQAELEAIRAISAGSHAHRDLETNLAIQDFALDPLDEEHREVMRFLLRTNMLKPAQEAELDRISGQATPSQETTKFTTKKATSATKSVRDWLEEDVDYELDAPIKETPENRKDLCRAMVLTATYIILLVIGWQMGGTDFLYRLAFAETPAERAAQSEVPLRNYFLVKETAVIDSAVIYNNQGVEQARIGERNDTLAARHFQRALAVANSTIHGNGDKFGGKAIPYALANANLGRLYFNAAAAELNGYLQDSLGQGILSEALRLLDRAYLSDSVALDVWHARGVVHYYEGSPEDSSSYYYELLDSLDYFQTLDYTPNLATLLQRERSRIIAVKIDQKDQRALEVSVRYFLDPSVEPKAELVVEALGTGKQPPVATQLAINGENTLVFSLQAPRREAGKMQAVKVEMRRQDITKVIDFREETFGHNWATPDLPTRTPAKDRNEAPILGEKAQVDFTVQGTLLDAATRKVLPNEDMTFNLLLDMPFQGNSAVQSIETTTDRYGNFVITGEALGVLLSTTTGLSIDVEGYKTYTSSFGKENPRNSNPLVVGELLLEKALARPSMVLINGGSFAMGSSEKSAPEDIRPEHEVSLDSYYIGVTEVTFSEYDAFCEATKRTKPDDQGWGRNRRPVIGVSWEDAVAYCNWLSEQHGFAPAYDETGKVPLLIDFFAAVQGQQSGYRLPTEAEWEYAARGGIMGNKSQVYAGSNDLSEVGWYTRNSKDQTQPVGQLRPNNAGTYDMSGNVWEWCHDRYGGYSYENQNNPKGPDFGSHRIIRGGAWIQAAEDCKVTTRQYRLPTEKMVYTGFRLAR